VNRTSPANIRTNGNTTVITHREFIADVAGVTTFGALEFAINPGLEASFPWLSTVANRFESYTFRKLTFVYETTKSASTNGSVMGVVDFDASEDPPTTKATMMAFSGATRSAVWQEFKYSSTGSNLHKFARERYTRSADLASNLDIKTYDVGNFILGAAGCADTSAVGELYVEYTVELKTPQIALAVSASAPLEAQYIYDTSPSSTLFYGASTPDSYGSVYATASSATLTFATAGTYIIMWESMYAAAQTWTSVTGSVTITQQLSAYLKKAYVIVTAAVGATCILTGSGFGGGTAYLNQTIIIPITPSALHYVKQTNDVPNRIVQSYRAKNSRNTSDSDTVYITSEEMVDSCVLTPLEKHSGSWARVKP
jgi:hypothetical protein